MNTIITDFPPITAYNLCDPSGVKECEFEEVVMRILGRLYPDYIIFPFRPDVRYDDTVWNPDLAVVDRNHGFWFVLEVEIASHHLEKHVLPQVNAFSYGKYGNDAIAQLSKGLSISKASAQTLLSIIPRDVVVVSNRHDVRWDEKLAAMGCKHMVISSYKNKISAQQIHKVYGELLPLCCSLGFGRVRATDGVIVTQAGSFWKEGVYEITGPNGNAKWQCSIFNGKAWLMKERGIIEFNDGSIVQILLRKNGSVLIQLPYA